MEHSSCKNHFPVSADNINALQDTATGTYSGVTVRKFINHLETTYSHKSISILEEEKKAEKEMVFNPDAMEVQEVILA